MSGFTQACAHMRQLQKWDGLSPFYLQPTSSTVWLSSVWPCKGCTMWTLFYGWQWIERKILWRLMKLRQGILQHWYTVSYSVLAKVFWKWQTLWKNGLIIAKDLWSVRVNFIVITITFSEKKIGGITFIVPLVLSWNYVKFVIVMFITNVMAE
jgi:hypothetical protein